METSKLKDKKNDSKLDKEKTKKKLKKKVGNLQENENETTKNFGCHFCKKSNHLWRSCRKRLRLIKKKKQLQEEKRENKYKELAEKIQIEIKTLHQKIEGLQRDFFNCKINIERKIDETIKQFKALLVVQKDGHHDQGMLFHQDTKESHSMERISERKKKKEQQKIQICYHDLDIYQHIEDKNYHVALLKRGEKDVEMIKLNKELNIDAQSVLITSNNKTFMRWYKLIEEEATILSETSKKQHQKLFKSMPEACRHA